MGEPNHMAIATETLLTTLTGSPEPRHTEASSKQLDITVLFTSVELTVAALRRAGELASRLNGRITLVVPQIVPYPAPLTSPPVLVEFNERRFRVLAAQSAVETSVQIYLCRDAAETLQSVLAPRSLVVIGVRRRWWPTAEQRLAARLRCAGHEVMVTRTE
jgi:hypothetical protein